MGSWNSIACFSANYRAPMWSLLPLGKGAFIYTAGGGGGALITFLVIIKTRTKLRLQSNINLNQMMSFLSCKIECPFF